MHRFFSPRHFIWEQQRGQGQAPGGVATRALTPLSLPEFRAAMRKTSSSKPRESGRNQESRCPAYEKENPRLGYEVCVKQNPRGKTEAAPDGSVVMRKPAYIRMINRRCSRNSAPDSFHLSRVPSWRRSQNMVP